jgi:hypothetical protein
MAGKLHERLIAESGVLPIYNRGTELCTYANILLAPTLQM